MGIPACCLSKRPISSQLLPIVRYSSQACSPEKLLRWVLSDTPRTGTMVSPARLWPCVSHDAMRMPIWLYIGWLTEVARRTISILSCDWTERYAMRNWIHLKISQYYNVLKIWMWSSIQLSSPSPKLCSERCLCMAYAHWKDLIFVLSCPHLRWWSIHVFFCWLNSSACSKSCADHTGCHGFHCS